jgi:hypothetical protein
MTAGEHAVRPYGGTFLGAGFWLDDEPTAMRESATTL